VPTDAPECTEKLNLYNLMFLPFFPPKNQKKIAPQSLLSIFLIFLSEGVSELGQRAPQTFVNEERVICLNQSSEAT
jgi:hypothetical protein